jgi:acyl carrier protein
MTAASADDVRSVVLERVAPALSARGLSMDALPDDFDLLLEGVVDSFGLLELISYVETRFGLELDLGELDAEDLTRLGPFCRYVAAQSTADVDT